MKSAREDAGISRKDAAKQIGIGYSTLADVENGNSQTCTFAGTASMLYGVNPKWMEQGKGDKFHARLERHASSDDVILIPHMNGRAKGGSGGLAPTHEYVVGSISVTHEFIHRRLPSITSKSNLAVIEAYGRSMEPTLLSGDLMIVDIGIARVDIPGLAASITACRKYLQKALAYS